MGGEGGTTFEDDALEFFSGGSAGKSECLSSVRKQRPTHSAGHCILAPSPFFGKCSHTTFARELPRSHFFTCAPYFEQSQKPFWSPNVISALSSLSKAVQKAIFVRDRKRKEREVAKRRF